jgi:hypothetical protein
VTNNLPKLWLSLYGRFQRPRRGGARDCCWIGVLISEHLRAIKEKVPHETNATPVISVLLKTTTKTPADELCTLSDATFATPAKNDPAKLIDARGFHRQANDPDRSAK